MRIFLFFSIVLIQLCWAASCQSEEVVPAEYSEEADAEELEETEIAETVYIDSVFLHQLEQSYVDGIFLTNYMDSVLEDANDQIENSFVEAKLDITGDGVEDYVILGNSFHHVWGSIVDGKTGAHLDLAASFFNGIFWNRPYPNESSEGILVSVMDASCSDNQRDLQVIYQSGSLPGSIDQGAYLEIYHYNTDSNHIELILNKQISHVWDENNLDDIWNENYEYTYIDHLYLKRTCCEEIVITEGVSSSDDVFDYAVINPKKGGWTKKMVYNQELQNYVEQ